MSKFKKIILIFICMLTLVGCWDKVEINDRAFVSAIGIDKYEKEGGLELKKSNRNRFTITFVFTNVKALRKGGGDEKPRFILSSMGQNVFYVSNMLTTRSNKTMFFGHTKAIIIGEKVARDSETFKEVIDGLERTHEIGRKVNIFISQGEAKKTIEVEPSLEPVTGTYLSGVMEAKERSSRFTPKTIGDIMISLHDCNCALIPRLIPDNKEIKVAGAAVIRDFKLVGWLGEIENRSIMFITDKVTSDDLDIIDDKITVSYAITDSVAKKTGRMENGEIKVDIFISLEGVLQQYKLETGNDVLDDKLMKRLEGLIEDKIKREVEGTIKKLQKEFKVDVIGIGEYLSKFKPDIWDKVKDDWRDVFPEIKIDVNVKAKIRRIGMTK